MGAIKFKGASLIEAVVASIIFIIVFVCSLETIVRLASQNNPGSLIIIEADHKSEMAMRKYSENIHPPGAYVEEFEWGKIMIDIKPYKQYEDLQIIAVRTLIDNSRKQISLDRIIRIKNDAKE